MQRAACSVAVSIAVAFLWAGCSECSLTGTSDDDSSHSEPWPLETPIAADVPESARGVAFVRRLRDLRRSIGFALEHLPEDDGDSARSALAELHELVRPDALGLSSSADVAVFVRAEHIGFVVPLDSPSTFRKEIERVGDRPDVEIRRLDGGDVRQASFDDASSVVQFTVRNGRVLVRTAPARPASGPSGPVDKTSAFQSFFAERTPARDRERWPREAPKRKLFETVVSNGDPPRAAGFVEPGAWVDELETEGQAAVIQERFANQLGPTAFRVEFDDAENRLQVDIRNREDPEEPSVISRMGKASDERPPLGGLVQPGVLGVLRLSVDPKKVYRTLVSSLPAEGREQLDVFWRHVRNQLLIDAPDAVLGNLTGHAAAVFYGLKGDQLEGPPTQVLRRVFELRATREVVLLPIKSYEKAERLLDKLTQITRGRLSRQRDEHTVQYIWLEDGSLEWALILGEEYVLFVDSATSLQKATQYERRGRRLTETQISDMGIGPLLEKQQRSGLYLDTGTLAELLRENGRERIAELLVPFRSVVLTSEMDEDASRTQLLLRMEGE